jgi:transcriptional regulator with XRE-family HTH domain
MKRKIQRKETKESGLWVATMFRLRKELGMTQAQLATAIGMSKDAVTSWEIGRARMRSTSALRISARLQRNIMTGQAEPITVAALVEPLVMEYDRKLRRRLGV